MCLDGAPLALCGAEPCSNFDFDCTVFHSGASWTAELHMKKALLGLSQLCTRVPRRPWQMLAEFGKAHSKDAGRRKNKMAVEKRSFSSSNTGRIVQNAVLQHQLMSNHLPAPEKSLRGLTSSLSMELPFIIPRWGCRHISAYAGRPGSERDCCRLGHR